MLYGIDGEFPAVAIVNLGRDPKSSAGAAFYEKENLLEELDTCRENVRCAVAGSDLVFYPFKFNLMTNLFVLMVM